MLSIIINVYVLVLIPIALLIGFITLSEELSRDTYNKKSNYILAFLGGVGQGAVLAFAWPFFLLCFIILFCGYILTMMIDVIKTIMGR